MTGSVKLNSAGGGSITLVTPSTASNVTATIPAVTDTLVNLGSTQTLTNKTLTAAGSNSVEATSGPTSSQLSGNRNKIINGAMMIDQRNAGASVSTSGLAAADVYCLDRWVAQGSQNSKFTIQQNAGSVTPPAGYTNYLGITSSSAYTVGAADYFNICQRIEGYNIADLGWGAAGALTVTLSFWIRSSLTGTFGGALMNNSGTQSYPFTYTISAANTWEQKSISISGSTSGTWVTTNGRGIQVQFGLGAGSTYSGTAGAWSGSTLYSATGAVSVVGTSGATWYVAGVQLEKGATATPFENRLYGTELALCQRYFEKSYNISDAPGTNTSVTGAGQVDFGATSNGSNNAYYTIPFKTPKRASATITGYTSAGTSGSWGYIRSGASGDGAFVASSTGENSAYARVTVGAAWIATEIYGHWTASAEL